MIWRASKTNKCWTTKANSEAKEAATLPKELEAPSKVIDPNKYDSITNYKQ